MNIFIIRIDEFLKNVDKNSITQEFKSQKRCIEYSLGRFLVKFAAKNFYGVQDVEIVVENKKPKLKNSALNFSISHSKNIAAVAFDEFDTGFDIEEMRDRNLEKLSKYFDRNFSDKTDFYKFWTSYEAEYKSKKQCLTSFELENYMCSVSHSGRKPEVKIFEVKFFPSKDKKLLDLQKSVCGENPENTLQIKELPPPVLM